MLTDEELTRIYKKANGEDVGKAQPLTTQRIFTAMRAIEAAATAPLIARIAELEADAKRWKKLKSIAGFGIRKNGVVELTVCFSGHEPGHIGQLDAALDNAMKEQP
jgi:hypothetical protein